MTSSLSSTCKNFFCNVLERAGKYVSPATLDFAEMIAVPGLTTTVSAFAMSFFGVPSSVNAKASLSLGAFASVCYGKLKQEYLENKIKKLARGSYRNLNMGLILEASHDWARFGLNFCNRSFLSNFKTAVRSEHYDRTKISSYNQLVHVLTGIEDYSLNTIWIRAHGKPGSIRFSRHCRLFTESYEIFDLFRKKLKRGGRIILETCNGTQMAEAISANCPDASVYADPGKNHSFVGFGFSSRGIPEFNDGTFCKGKKSIRLYRTGYLMYGPTT